MIALFIRYFFIIFGAIYIYQKVLFKNIKLCTSMYELFVAILISYISSLLFEQTVILKITIITVLSGILLVNLQVVNHFSTFLLISISYGLSFISHIISSALISVIYFLIYKEPNLLPYSIVYLPTGLIHIMLIILVMKIPQFRSGILSILQQKAIYILSLLSILLLIFISFISTKQFFTTKEKIHLSLLLLSFSLLLLYYWRHRIKQTYIENMRRLETLTFENTIADKDKQIKTLEDNNAYLGRIIHKYRKTIPALELSVMELLQNCDTLTPEELKTKAASLQNQLIELQENRDNSLDKYQKEASITTHTGLHTVDAMLALMEKRAKQEWIRYKTQINPNIRELATASIKEADLLHLLGDLTENAFHAVSSADDKDILIHFGKLNDYFLLEISDSGAAFDIQTYQNFGMEPSSSHTEDGGTGTGLMDIWKIKKEYKASLYIYEYEPGTNTYTKKISFLFDSKNHFLLKTYRDKEIKNTLLRGDLHVIPHKAE